ncbi:MAG: hybrid sensor histidine kinase/response regulator transcription factor [Bacteroidales bacterium]
MNILRSVFLVLLLGAVELASGQGNSLFFRHLTTNDGLSNNTVYAINEDTLGFIWIGTRSGLNRFDGHSFRVYDNTSGLRNVFINTIFKDSRGRIWVGTQGGGISRYEYETGGFTTFVNDPFKSNSISHDDVQAIVEDSKSHLWIGTHEGGLNMLDMATNIVLRIPIDKMLPAGFHIDRINTLLLENDTLIWIGTLDGLFTFNQATNRITPYLVNGRPVNARILALFLEGPDKIWLGTQAGIIKVDRHLHAAEYVTSGKSGLSSDLVVDIKQSPDGRIMIATDGGGLDIYDPASGEYTSFMNNPNSPNSISNNSVYAIFIDSFKGLWVGNYIGGINYYSEYDWKFQPVKHELNDPQSLSDNHVRCFYQDRQGALWIGTLGGLNQYDQATEKFRIYTADKKSASSLASNSVLSIYEDHDGKLWIGTFGGGISILDKRRNTFTKFRHPDDPTGSLDKANIYSIIETPGNKLCIASLGGIYLLDRNTNKMRRFMVMNSRLSNNTVKVLCKDKSGNIWAGTNLGVNRLNHETGEIKVYSHSNANPNSLSNNRILSIFLAMDGKLWIGTEGGGVSVFDPGTERFSFVTTSDGLPDNVVNSVLQDDQGIFWLATNKGLVRFDQATRKMRIYTSADGLQANEFNQNSALKCRDGNLYFGGINGYNVISPGNLITDFSPPKVILTDLYISNKLVRVGDDQSPLDQQLFLEKRISMGYETTFELDFAALGFINKGKYQYSYMMKGLTQEWTEFRENRSASFSNLPPGLYTFMVRARNNDGVQNGTPASIQIRILPPLWKTWWAFCLYALIILGILFLFMRYNISWIRVKNQLILERKEKEQLEELNQMKLGFFTNISHEFKTPLTLILGYLDNLKSSGNFKSSETLVNIEKNAQRLLILINQLLEFRKAENGLMKLKTTKGNILLFLAGIQESFSEFARMKNIQFELNTHGNIPEIWFDAEKVEKIMYNLLSNAFKFVYPGGKIEINLAVAESVSTRQHGGNGNFLEITVKDTGQGMSQEDLKNLFNRFYQESKDINKTQNAEGSGIGLAYSKKLVELHHGEISVQSEQGAGSSFIIRLPIGKDHLTDDEIREELNFQLKMDYHGLSEAIHDDVPRTVVVQQEDVNNPILLVVDDNPMICNVIADKFQNEYQVIIAANGIEGLEKARKYVPDVIISDILMPGMDGIEFCQNIKQELLTCHIPVIMLTAKSDDDSQIQGIRTGADAYIAKPYNPDLLQATLRNLVNSRKVLRNKFYGKEEFVPSEVVSNKMDEKFLNKLITMIEASAEEETIDISDLCREIAMSRSALYRKLKALTGNSIQDFIRMVKLRKASRMLVETTLTISEIAYQSGFPNTKHFSTSFRKQFGKTPSEYRQRS